MGANGHHKVPYLHKVDNQKIADITVGVCFIFGDNCNIFFNNGKEIGRLDYVGNPGPGMQFKVSGKKDSTPGGLVDKYVELLTYKGIPVPLMD